MEKNKIIGLTLLCIAFVMALMLLTAFLCIRYSGNFVQPNNMPKVKSLLSTGIINNSNISINQEDVKKLMNIINSDNYTTINSDTKVTYGTDEDIQKIMETKLLFEEYNINLSYCSQFTNIGEIALCLNKELMTFYKYNLSNTGKGLSFDELFTEGGVCQHYAEWYVMRAQFIGINGTEVIFPIKLDGDVQVDHDVAIISNEQGYCIMDMDIFSCHYFTKSDIYQDISTF